RRAGNVPCLWISVSGTRMSATSAHRVSNRERCFARAVPSREEKREVCSGDGTNLSGEGNPSCLGRRQRRRSAVIFGGHRIRLSEPSKLFRRCDPSPLEGRSSLSRRNWRRPQTKTPGGSALPCRCKPGRRNQFSGCNGGSGLWHSGGCLPGRRAL